MASKPTRRTALAGTLALAAGAGATPVVAQQSGAASARANVRFLQPATMAKPSAYTHIVEVTGPGRMLYTSGERGSDKDGKLPADFRAQAVQAFENLKAALTAAGATFDDVIKMNVYLIDMKAHHTILGEVRANYVSKTNPPADTQIAVAALTREGALVEIDVVAALPPG